MKNILIVLALVIVLGLVGFCGTAEISRQMQNSRRQQMQSAAPSPAQDQGLAESERELGDAIQDLSDRERYAMIGGGVGAAVGLLSGFLITARLGAKKSALG